MIAITELSIEARQIESSLINRCMYYKRHHLAAFELGLTTIASYHLERLAKAEKELKEFQENNLGLLEL